MPIQKNLWSKVINHREHGAFTQRTLSLLRGHCVYFVNSVVKNRNEHKGYSQRAISSIDVLCAILVNSVIKSNHKGHRAFSQRTLSLLSELCTCFVTSVVKIRNERKGYSQRTFSLLCELCAYLVSLAVKYYLLEVLNSPKVLNSLPKLYFCITKRLVSLLKKPQYFSRSMMSGLPCSSSCCFV